MDLVVDAAAPSVAVAYFEFEGAEVYKNRALCCCENSGGEHGDSADECGC